MSETIPSESSKDPLWVVAKLYFDDMLDKRLDIIEDVPMPEYVEYCKTIVEKFGTGK